MFSCCYLNKNIHTCEIYMIIARRVASGPSFPCEVIGPSTSIELSPRPNFHGIVFENVLANSMTLTIRNCTRNVPVISELIELEFTGWLVPVVDLMHAKFHEDRSITFLNYELLFYLFFFYYLLLFCCCCCCFFAKIWVLIL